MEDRGQKTEVGKQTKLTKGFDVAAGGRDSHHTAFRRCGKHRRKWNTFEPQAATEKEFKAEPRFFRVWEVDYNVWGLGFS